jgi:DNA-binding transcriptional regulator YiaG
MTWAEQIKAARGDLSQSEAARAISLLLSVRTLQDWELGRRPGPPAWVQELIMARMRRATKKPLP